VSDGWAIVIVGVLVLLAYNRGFRRVVGYTTLVIVLVVGARFAWMGMFPDPPDPWAQYLTPPASAPFDPDAWIKAHPPH
jgi:hypothetical protein